MSSQPNPPVMLVPVDSESEAEWVRDLLSRCGLPTDDLQAENEPAPAGDHLTLYTIKVDGDCVGCIGIERYGDAGLLRSAAVAEPHRGKGYGRSAVRTLETRLHDDGVDTLYLLTTTAAGFFAELGYERTDREVVPEAVQESAEFSDLCPDSATVMRRRL